MKILVVDDDRHVRELAGMYLEKEGYGVEYARNGHDALVQFRRRRPDLVVLDQVMPGFDGAEVCRALRRESQVPILMLTARNGGSAAPSGAKTGPDECLAKPFSPRDLTSRVKELLQRHAGRARPRMVTLYRLEIDSESRTVTINGRPVTMRAKEFDLLSTLAENFDNVLSREQLLELAWGYAFYGETRTIDVHVQHVRQKLAGSGVEIQTVRGVGYKLAAESAMLRTG